MPPETKYLFTNRFLEAVYESQCNDHNRHADNCGCNGKPNNKTGERFLQVQGDAASYKKRKIHNKIEF